MTAMDWLMIGHLVAGMLVGILFSELARSMAHWFARPKKSDEYENSGA